MPEPRPYSPGLEGIVAGETSLGYVDGERGRLLYRGYRIGDLVDRGTYPAVANLLWTGEWDPAHRLPTSPVPGPVMTVLRALPRDDQADGRAPDGGLGLGRDPGAAVAADGRAGPRAHLVLALGAGRVRPAAGGRGAGRARPLARPRRGVPLPAHGRAAGPRDRACARCLLHRRVRAWLQRIDVHGPDRDVDPIGYRLGGRRRDRDAQGAAPRRRAVGGRRPAQPDRVRRAMPRRGSARRSAAATG